MRKKLRGYDLFMPEEINSTAVEEARASASFKRFFGAKPPCVREGEPLAITRLADVRDGSFGTFVHVEGEDGNEYGVKYFKFSDNKSEAEIEAGVRKEYGRLVVLGGLGGGVVRAYARGHVMTASGRGEKTYPAILMDIAKGFPLADVVGNSLLSGSADELPSAMRVARAGLAVGRTYSRLHAAGMTHRDGSPTNVFLNIGEHEDRAILIDFGNSFAAKETLTLVDEERGKGRLATECFGAPEVFLAGQAAADIRHQPAQDIWTLGALLYYMRTASHPHKKLIRSLPRNDLAALVRIKRENPVLLEEGLDAAHKQGKGNATMSDLDECLSDLILRCTSFDLNARPSMEEVVDELEALISYEESPIVASPDELSGEYEPQGTTVAKYDDNGVYRGHWEMSVEGEWFEFDEEGRRLIAVPTRKDKDRDAADIPNPMEFIELARRYEYGEGVKQDHEEAARLYRLAVYAQNSLGDCYYHGWGVVQDRAKAVKFYRMAADQGCAAAQNNLGNCYYHGWGVVQDRAKAVKFYRMAADQGCAAAQNNLGNCYYHGWGVVQDRVEAVKLYRLAAAQGDASAQNNLGHCYEFGQAVVQDFVEAARLYRLAADQGCAAAQYSLGCCYEQGRGVDQDRVEAVKFFCLAADQGDANATQALCLLI